MFLAHKVVQAAKGAQAPCVFFFHFNIFSTSISSCVDADGCKEGAASKDAVVRTKRRCLAENSMKELESFEIMMRQWCRSLRKAVALAAVVALVLAAYLLVVKYGETRDCFSSFAPYLMQNILILS